MNIPSTDAAGAEANFAFGLTDEEYEGVWMWRTGNSEIEIKHKWTICPQTTFFYNFLGHSVYVEP